MTDKERMIEELEEKLARIRANCKGWIPCQDGSYEQALSMQGYYTLAKQLKELKEENDSTTTNPA